MPKKARSRERRKIFGKIGKNQSRMPEGPCFSFGAGPTKTTEAQPKNDFSAPCLRGSPAVRQSTTDGSDILEYFKIDNIDLFKDKEKEFYQKFASSQSMRVS